MLLEVLKLENGSVKNAKWEILKLASLTSLLTIGLSYYPVLSQIFKSILYENMPFQYCPFLILQTAFIVLLSAYAKYIFSANDKEKLSENKVNICFIFIACFIYIAFIPDQGRIMNNKYDVISSVFSFIFLMSTFYINWIDKKKHNIYPPDKEIEDQKFSSNKIIADVSDADLLN